MAYEPAGVHGQTCFWQRASKKLRMFLCSQFQNASCPEARNSTNRGLNSRSCDDVFGHSCCVSLWVKSSSGWSNRSWRNPSRCFRGTSHFRGRVLNNFPLSFRVCFTGRGRFAEGQKAKTPCVSCCSLSLQHTQQSQLVSSL